MSLTPVERIDLANIALMLISCVLAFALPFELFLFSYAVLGPLHYLTEIGWLHKKGYFTTGKNDYLFLGIIAGLITLGFFGLSKFLGSISTALVYVAFLSAAAMVLIKSNKLKMLSIGLIGLSAFLFSNSNFYEVFFAIYLPTIIHVFLFTGLFILFGALKNRSIPGMVSVLVFIACALSFFMLQPGYTPYLNNEYLYKSYQGFLELNRQLINLFHLENLQEFNKQTLGQNLSVIFGSGAGISVMRFIAFAYTYHYLNWFSKTSVIQWHKVPKNTLYAVLATWAISVGLYIYNYEVGLKWLFLLSFMHVLLEFPLNYRSIIGIGQELRKIARNPASLIHK